MQQRELEVLAQPPPGPHDHVGPPLLPTKFLGRREMGKKAD